MCIHVCRCAQTEFCVLCFERTFRNEPEYKLKTRLVIFVDEENVEFQYKFLCETHTIDINECLLIKETISGNNTYSIQNKEEMMKYFCIPINLIKLEYCQDINGDFLDHIYISPDNLSKIKEIAQSNTKKI
jgi:hypothetical protein